MYKSNASIPIGELFPPLDYFHFQIGKSQPGAFSQPALPGWQEFMTLVNISAAVLYPSVALAVGRIPYPDWAIVVTRAYNDWLHAEYTSQDSRLRGMALLPMQDPEAAIDELHRAVTELHLAGAMLPSNGLKDTLGAKDYWPVYAEAERLNVPLALHGGAHGGFGFDTMNYFAPAHALGHPMGMMINLTSMVFNGVFDRFPRLRVGYLEGGVAWLLPLLERFDRSYATQTPYDYTGRLVKLQEGESIREYVIKRMREGRIYIGSEGCEPDLAYICRIVGSQSFMYSSDFPHEVSPRDCLHEIEELQEQPELSAADKEAILAGNATRFYGLD
jgi:predicted TIM-barrel fold metal-dependent hydrolase